MPKVVTFSLFFPLSISSCAVWASALLQQKQKRAASIFFIAFLLGEIGRPVRVAHRSGDHKTSERRLMTSAGVAMPHWQAMAPSHCYNWSEWQDLQLRRLTIDFVVEFRPTDAP